MNQTHHSTLTGLTMFQRIANQDQTVIKDCVDTYGSFIWALARKFTGSTEEAEAATQEIFTDIWRYSERSDRTESAKDLLIARIALRRLITCLLQTNQISTTSTDIKN